MKHFKGRASYKRLGTSVLANNWPGFETRTPKFPSQLPFDYHNNACYKPATVKCKAVPLHATEALGGEEIQLLLIPDPALDGGEWSASRPDRALPRGKTPGTHCT
jgi:hypothetical protein